MPNFWLHSGDHIARIGSAAVLAILITACSTLPVSGPTGASIRKAANSSSQASPFPIVEVASEADLPSPLPVPVSQLVEYQAPPTDLIGPGDVLDITIYEVGVSLFGSPVRAPAGSTSVGSVAGNSNTETIAGVRVDDNGQIRLPFVGTLRAAGRTAPELQAQIRRGLQGMSQDPQVLVAIRESLTNSVLVAGEVSKNGRLTLPTGRETLSSVLALGGGYRGEAKNLVARVDRGDRSFEVRLSDVLENPQRDLLVLPGDKITVVNRPQSFSVLGASSKVDEVVFPRSRMNLAQAVAIAGGANPNLGDAGAVFVFRYVQQPDGSEAPVVYHVNMMRPQSYLLAQRFQIRDRDVVYIGNAQANQPGKLVQLISQLFLPLTTVRSVIPVQ